MRIPNPKKTHWRNIIVSTKDESGEAIKKEDDKLKVELAFIPHGIMEELRDDLAPHANALARINAKIRKEDRANEPMSAEEDKTFREAIKAYGRYNESLVKYGIRGHDGFVYDDETPVKCVIENEKLNGHDIPVLSKETLELYRLVGLINDLSVMVMELNTLSEDIKKK